MKLRSALFAQAGDAVSRYGISFERVLLHLWRARQGNRGFFLHHVVHVDDLVHAVACMEGNSIAWADLAAHYERTLVRRCRGSHDEIAATIQTRRFFAELRRAAMQSEDAGFETMSHYLGTRPLKNWLSERLQAARSPRRADTVWRQCQLLRNGTCDHVSPPRPAEPFRFRSLPQSWF